MSDRTANKSGIMILAIILAAGGLGLGTYNLITFLGTELGKDGIDGKDQPGNLVVGIIGLGQGQKVSGEVTIEALIAGTENYNIQVLINGSLNATSVPFKWNSSKVEDGWWNIKVIVSDTDTGDSVSDDVLVIVDNTPTSLAKAYHEAGVYYVNGGTYHNYNLTVKDYDTNNEIDLSTDIWTASHDAYYQIYAQLTIIDLGPDESLEVIISVNGGAKAMSVTQSSFLETVTGSTEVLIWLNEGDQTRLRFMHSDSTDRQVYGGVHRSFIAITEVELD